MECPTIVIGAIASGAGKTTLALAITRALSLRGLRVQTFKVGPDFLDPTHLALVSGRPCYNLDSWMCSQKYVQELYVRKTADADVAIIEGVMGLFDGASPTSLEGSTAEIAKMLDAPVLLTVNVRGMARSLAALVQGACNFEPGIRICGVIANHCGSDRHADMLQQALRRANLPSLIGSIPTGAFPELASRHLGLIAANPAALQALDAYAAVAEQHLQLETLVPALTGMGGGKSEAGGRRSEIGDNVSGLDPRLPRAGDDIGQRLHAPVHPSPPLSLALAQDEAFSFYYPDTLEALEQAGIQLIPFSPLHDTTLPAGIQGIYLGGGYPEMHAQQLSENTTLLAAIRQFAQKGGLVYAECGGLMYVAQSITTPDGAVYAMAGLLPFGTRMAPKRKVLGYVEVTLTQDSLWGRQGQTCRGHEFHYSDIITEDSCTATLQRDYACHYRGDRAPRSGGFRDGNILADYVHLHWASHPGATRSFIQSIGATA